MNINNTKLDPKNNLSDEWIYNQIEALMRECPFHSEESFILDPEKFDQIGDHKDKIYYLIKRFQLPYEDLNIYLHGNLKHGKPVSGLAEYPAYYNTKYVNDDENMISAEGDKTITCSGDMKNPVITIKYHETLEPLKSKAAIYLNQDYSQYNDFMSSTIAHEVAHLYLYHHKIHTLGIRDKMVAEYQTDLTTFIMGLGTIMLRSAKIHDGAYLSYRQMQLAQKWVMKKNKIDIDPGADKKQSFFTKFINAINLY